MRDYALTRALSLEETGRFSLRQFWRNLSARRAVSRLTELDDHILRDIGVRREEIAWAAGLPLTVNAALALEERAWHRRRAEARKGYAAR